ncbi:DUF2812 domain-containing protein [Proteiniclasticum ruminis]|uniref:DUF2812 domain-containing protein n=1 Tax=Proteiniclasticum ruminis TaxID=398199 RepID=A0A1I5BQC9_9CLOT|nr:DUF2812 domain-containing protein [Proteiniclasticum ruminis]SFN76641.1 Protein of unknown function [Proteiniclasticum ruminis]
MKLIRKLLPVNVYDMAKTQSYLKDMSQKGYFIKKIGTFASFEKGEPEVRTYRLEPLMKKEGRPREEKLEYYESCGWKYVCTIASAFHLYETSRKDFEELHTDPLTQSYAFERLNQKMKAAFMIILLLIPITIFQLLHYFFLSDTPVLNAVKYGSGTYTALMVLVTLVLGREIFENRKKLRFLLINLQTGREMVQEEHYQLKYTPYVFHTMIVVLSMLLIITNIRFLFTGWEKKLADYGEDMPALRLSDIEDHKSFEIDDQYRRSNLISYEAGELASSVYEISESGVIKEEMWKDQSGIYSPHLETEYYELRLRFLGERLLKDLIVDALDFHRHESFTFEELLETRFDQAVTIRVKETQMFFGRLGKKIVYVNYQGYKDLTEHLDELYDKISTFN